MVLAPAARRGEIVQNRHRGRKQCPEH